MTRPKSAPNRSHREPHSKGREGWLRAGVMGADDGLVSTACLMIGVAASSAAMNAILLAGVAGLVAGALSMAAGEYVSVSSLRDVEDANIAQEKRELATNSKGELRELALIYEKRGLKPDLARQVAEQLSEHDVLEAHMRDELGLNESTLSHPFQAATVSAASFGLAAILPIGALLLSPVGLRIPFIALFACVGLSLLGALGGHLGKAPLGRAALRVVVGGGLAMAGSALVGRLLGVLGI
ncbi:MAG: VIT family protein [Holophaga sp.]